MILVRPLPFWIFGIFLIAWSVGLIWAAALTRPDEHSGAAPAASDAAPTVADPLHSVSLQSRITSVQPMTGIVMWEDSENSHTDAIALEYSYLRYDDVVKAKGQYDWSAVERKLNAIAGRKHQAVLRFYETWPGRQTTVPEYIKALPGYHEVQAKSEGRDTGFPDWSHPEYQRFILEFYERFAAKYDRDPRLAFLEVGFGLWAEYHIYSGPEELGRTFPSKEFQARFFRHLTKVFQETPWMISQDAHEASRTPFATERELLDLRFGIFDDSFPLAWEPGYNLEGWEFFGRDRWKRSPCGGETLFRNQQREEQVAAAWAKEAASFHITFMIGEQWPRWTTMEHIREHGLACGYKFRVTAFEASDTAAYVTVTNTGVAPIYYDAFVAVNGVRARDSLKGLLPGEARRFTVASGGKSPKLTIECDRLVPGQRIEFEADLDGLPRPVSSSAKSEKEAKVVQMRALPKGISTWVYHYRDGVARQVKRFNAEARPDLRFRYLFPYAGSPTFDAEDRRITMRYSSEASRAYAKTLPRDTLLFPIVDGRNDHGEFDGWTDEQYREAARQVAECILDDSNAAGVQIDIEPFKPDHLPFYQHLRTMLNAKGKYCTMFVGPWEGELLRRIFQSCDIVVMSGYDLGRENMGVQAYRGALRRGIASFQQAAEETGGHYMVGIPAAASWGEYEYAAGGPEGRKETGTTQEEYVRAALEELKPYRERAQFLGIALWHMSDPETESEEPDKATEPTKFPNIIRPSVWKMLARY